MWASRPAVSSAPASNGMTPRQMCAAFIENDGGDDDLIHPSIFVQPGLERIRPAAEDAAEAPCASRLARGARTSVGRRARRRTRPRVADRRVRKRRDRGALRSVFSAPAAATTSALTRRLVLVATDLDTGAVAPFGLPGWDDVPISRAVTASAALPGPVPAGAHRRPPLRRRRAEEDAARACAARRGHRPPPVPEPARALRRRPHPRTPRGRAATRSPGSSNGGLPLVASQGLALADPLAPRARAARLRARAIRDVDIALFEPDRRDPEMFGANTFSYSARRQRPEHAYQSTRSLRAQRGALGGSSSRTASRSSTRARRWPPSARQRACRRSATPVRRCADWQKCSTGSDLTLAGGTRPQPR